MFQLQLSGNIPRAHLGRELRHLDPEFDDYRSILHEVCGMLETREVSFTVQGFGETKWGVDTATNLVVVHEQLPGLFSWASDERSESFDLDFYEQGVERRLVLSSSGPDICVEGKPINTGQLRLEAEGPH